LKICIIGGSGYTGAELIRLLSNHSQVKVTKATSTKYSGKKVSELYPNLADVNLYYEPFSEDVIEEADFFFSALPHTKSMDVIPLIHKAGKKVVDLSADYRLGGEKFEKYYGNVHKSPELIEKAVYGLPELYAQDIKNAQIVANPGCYPTAVILALAPALKMGLISDIQVSAISGVTGAGKTPSEVTHFNYANESVWAYKIAGAHQHLGEIEGQLTNIAGAEQNVTFTPQLGPYSRGIYAVCTASLEKKEITEKLIDDYKAFYKDALFVKILEEPPVLKTVTGSNYCYVYPAVDQHTNKLVVISAIDNLVKGASGQAIQNMNLMLGYEENEGLEIKGLYP
jgi:N-acetyl-gamma-glutamyl-phosphate reductase